MLKNYLLVFFISMVPIIELRGAIPIGLGMGLPVLPTYLVCVIGNMIPVPFIYLFARKFLIWPAAGAAAVRGHPAAGHGCMDRNAGGFHPGYEVQGRGQGLHGRCAAGGRHHGSGQCGPAGRTEQPVLGGLRKKRLCSGKEQQLTMVFCP